MPSAWTGNWLVSAWISGWQLHISLEILDPRDKPSCVFVRNDEQAASQNVFECTNNLLLNNSSESHSAEINVDTGTDDTGKNKKQILAMILNLFEVFDM